MLSSFAFPEPPKVVDKKRNRMADEASTSMQDLSELIGRLGAQLEKLEKKNAIDGANDKFIINPLAADVVQAYDTLLQQNEHLTHHCCCCADMVEAAPGIPWFAPYHRPEDPLQAAYTHWCTLMRCLPVMDTVAQTYVQTIGHFAMRQLMHAMRGNTRYVASPPLQRHSQYQGSSHTLLSNKTSNSGSSTLVPVLLKNSSSCLNDQPETTLRTKADAWIPQRLMMDEHNTTGYHHHYQHHHHPERTAPVSNTNSSPLPAPSNTTFTSPLTSRHYHATKLRRWFKRHNKVAPVDNRQEQ
ncbi:hypothetical protein BJV82DRAFT_11305 [Fennellomyces sp. T-0311]|nr:hypothetical protein BJV82DRAFT_11305 [Fennellomyces sp. T-0311]